MKSYKYNKNKMRYLGMQGLYPERADELMSNKKQVVFER